jgi:hypothetical protein
VLFVSVEAIFEKFRVNTVLINGVTIAAALFCSMSHAVEQPVAGQVRISDLSQRPTISSTLGAGQSRQLKIAEFGEVADIEMAMQVYQEVEQIRQAKAKYPNRFLTGQATLIDQGKFSADFDVCLVNHLQNDLRSDDGQYYLFVDDSPVLYNKRYVDFFTKSHEVEHCFFMVKFPEKYKPMEQFEQTHVKGGSYARYNNYVLSFKEVAGDLGAILDYMRQTGTNDLYTEFLRPFRVSALGVSNHKTAWALDVVLKDVDMASIQRKEAAEIPALVEHLMEKHFMGPDGTYFPNALPLDGAPLSIDKPAARALYAEVLADMQINGNIPFAAPSATDKLARDVHQSVSRNISSYAQVAPPQAVGLAMQLYGKLASKYDLAKLKFTLREDPAKAPQQVSSFASEYLGR